MAKPGRPTIYTEWIRDEFCRRIAQGRTMRSVCRDEDMPDRECFQRWIIENRGEVRDESGVIVIEGFYSHYARAREIGMEQIADETMEIADDGTNDYIEVETSKGKKKVIFDRDHVQRSKLRVDNRWKYLAMMAPRKYGNNVLVKSQTVDKDGNPVDPVVKTDDILKAALDAVKDKNE